MRLYRIVGRKWADTAFSGEGARRVGGRFTPVGVPAVYCTSQVALAALEVMVHFDEMARKKKWSLVAADMPDDLVPFVVPPATLGTDWREVPAPSHLQGIGARWFETKPSVAMVVPSVFVPQDPNVLLDPTNPDFKRITIEGAEDYEFDPRLLKASD